MFKTCLKMGKQSVLPNTILLVASMTNVLLIARVQTPGVIETCANICVVAFTQSGPLHITAWSLCVLEKPAGSWSCRSPLLLEKLTPYAPGGEGKSLRFEFRIYTHLSLCCHPKSKIRESENHTEIVALSLQILQLYASCYRLACYYYNNNNNNNNNNNTTTTTNNDTNNNKNRFSTAKPGKKKHLLQHLQHPQLLLAGPQHWNWHPPSL